MWAQVTLGLPSGLLPEPRLDAASRPTSSAGCQASAPQPLDSGAAWGLFVWALGQRHTKMPGTLSLSSASLNLSPQGGPQVC